MKKVYISFLVIVFLLGSCVGMNVDIKTPSEKIAYAEATLTGLIQSATTLINAGVIRGESLDYVEALVDEGKLAVRDAWQAYDTGLDYSVYLGTLNRVLLRLNSYVQEKKGEK